MIKLSIGLAALGIALLALPLLPAQPGAMVVAPTATIANETLRAKQVALGRQLFSAKGCVQCHSHAAIAGSGMFGGDDVPDLTNRPLTSEYLRLWLANPANVRPNTRMPNLELHADEIEALIAFLQAGK